MYRRYFKHIRLWTLVAAGAIMVFWPVALAQAADPGDSAVADTAPGCIIDSVEITTENVFDLSDPRYDNLLFHLANHAHIVTRRVKVRQELLLQKGDPYDTALVAESVRNLRNLKYLFKSDIRLRKGSRGENILAVTTSDKWTTSGGISPGRSGGRNRLEVSLTENNFLGLGIYMTHELFFLEEERTFYQAEVYDGRMWGSDLAVGFGYSDDPRLGRLVFTLGRPLYSLNSRWGWEISGVRVRQRSDYYLDEALAARDRLKSIGIQESIQYRFGGDRLKYYVMFLHSYTSLADLGRKYGDSISLPPETINRLVPRPGVDSVYHYLQATVRLQQIRFAEYLRLNRFQQPEDINLGLDARASVGFTIPLHMKRIWYLRLNPQYSVALGDVLLLVGASGQDWRSENRTIRTVVSGYGKAYWQYRTNQTLVGAVNYLSDRLQPGGQTVYEDEDRGLRGYPLYFAGGDSRIVVNLENRFFSDVEVLSVGIGAAVFADIGNIWAQGDPLAIRRTKASVGGGLRLGANRATNAEIIRFDLAYALSRGCWQISAGTDQYF
jgi:hypothetical protein